MSRFAHAAAHLTETVSAWDLDWQTIGWVGWIVYFFVLETVTLMQGEGQELTEHLRGAFIGHSLTWFLAVGLWAWVGIHLLAPALEAWLIEVVKTPTP